MSLKDVSSSDGLYDCSVQLARRVLQVERSNAALNKELEQGKLQVTQLAEQVSSFCRRRRVCLIDL